MRNESNWCQCESALETETLYESLLTIPGVVQENNICEYLRQSSLPTTSSYDVM